MQLEQIIRTLVAKLAEIKEVLEKRISPSETQNEETNNNATSSLAEIDLQYMAFGLVLKGIDPSECADFTQLLAASGVNPDAIYMPSKTALEESTLLYRLAIALNAAKAAFNANITPSKDNAARLQEAEKEIGDILTRLEQEDPRKIAHKQPAPRYVDPLNSEFAELDRAIADANQGLLSSSQQTVFARKRPPTPAPERTPEENEHIPKR